jgi:hypothetical protein
MWLTRNANTENYSEFLSSNVTTFVRVTHSLPTALRFKERLRKDITYGVLFLSLYTLHGRRTTILLLERSTVVISSWVLRINNHGAESN